MRLSLRVMWLVAGLGLLVFLSGCPGIPGGGGGGAAAQQPPGTLPPPGLESGGVRTLLGTTITPPTNSVLLISYSTGASPASGTPPTWQSVRRITVTDTTVLLEGINYNGRDEAQPRDVNRVVQLNQVTPLTWRYEGAPTPPPSTTGKPTTPPSRRGR